MSYEETAPHAPAAVEEPYIPPAPDTWAEEPLGELPPRPRRRLLGTGGNPVPVALLGVLLLACGFIAGVLVEKGQSSSTAGSGASGLAARIAALRGAGGATGGGGTAAGGAAGSGAAGSGVSGSGTAGVGAASNGAATGGAGGAANSGGAAAGAGGFAGRFGGLGGAGGATIGEVSYISGDTLYVTNTEGNTVKVTVSPAAAVTKTVKADIHGIHPGETVVVRGTKGSTGAVSAESVSVSSGGAVGGGLSALFGGGGGGRSGGVPSGGSPSGTPGSGASGSGEAALFGK
jgi:hypothetical protein